MVRNKGYVIQPHRHTAVHRTLEQTQEVLFIESGRIRVTFYFGEYPEVQIVLARGDLVLLISGGHGFEMLEDSKIIEVKQGPFLDDKIRFTPQLVD
jgi:mannose-6-phosphate isomerase-like protein (cupin superfamily)